MLAFGNALSLLVSAAKGVAAPSAILIKICFQTTWSVYCVIIEMALNCSDCRTLRNCINLLSAKWFAVVSPLRCAAPMCFCPFASLSQCHGGSKCPQAQVLPGSRLDPAGTALTRTESCLTCGRDDKLSLPGVPRGWIGQSWPTKSHFWLQLCCVFYDSCFIAQFEN